MTTRRTGLAASTIIALRSISAAILANPKNYNQQVFVANFETAQEAGCIAFHHARLHRTAKQLKNLVTKHDTIQNATLTANSDCMNNPFFIAAKKDLKLTEDQAIRLLGGIDRWPKKYWDAYGNAKTSKGRARALHNRIEFFIATNGTDEAVQITRKR